MKFLEFILIIILLAVLAISSYFIYLNFPTSPKELIPGYIPDVEVPESTELQFYPNMRYQDKIITYKIEDACSEQRTQDVEQAFRTIQAATILQFTQTTLNPEISILCSKLPEPTQEQKNYFIAGEGGPTSVINTSLYAVIFNGSISLFREESCEQPLIAIHELLHALGFDHSQNKKSIMYPISDCKQVITQEIINEINQLYQGISLPDLRIEKVTATKSGRYIGFNITVLNQGLQDINQAQLVLTANNENVKTFELNEIEIGTSKFLTVSNLAGPRTFNQLTFQVISTQPELSLENNQVTLSL